MAEALGLYQVAGLGSRPALSSRCPPKLPLLASLCGWSLLFCRQLQGRDGGGCLAGGSGARADGLSANEFFFNRGPGTGIQFTVLP